MKVNWSVSFMRLLCEDDSFSKTAEHSNIYMKVIHMGRGEYDADRKIYVSATRR